MSVFVRGPTIFPGGEFLLHVLDHRYRRGQVCNMSPGSLPKLIHLFTLIAVTRSYALQSSLRTTLESGEEDARGGVTSKYDNQLSSLEHVDQTFSDT